MTEQTKNGNGKVTYRVLVGIIAIGVTLGVASITLLASGINSVEGVSSTQGERIRANEVSIQNVEGDIKEIKVGIRDILLEIRK